jgi:dTMP kinase
VICDRYLASSLVLQRLDGVSPGFVWQLNQHADRPDLCIILSGDASRAPERAEKRGLYSRFHRGGQVVSMAEAALYATAAAELAEHGFAVLTHDIGTQTPGEVAETLAAAVLARMQDQAGDA